MANINLITKLSKTSSRDQWGDLNYHSYKTPDGTVRARLFPIAGSSARLEVRKFDRYIQVRTRPTWESVEEIGCCFIALEDDDKGLKSKEAIKQINTLLEIYNEQDTAQVGRTVQMMGYGSRWERNSYDVTAVAVRLNTSDELTVFVKLGTYGAANVSTDKIRDWTPEVLSDNFKESIDMIRTNLKHDLTVLNEIQAAVDLGATENLSDDYYYTTKTHQYDFRQLGRDAKELIAADKKKASEVVTL